MAAYGAWTALPCGVLTGAALLFACSSFRGATDEPVPGAGGDAGDDVKAADGAAPATGSDASPDGPTGDRVLASTTPTDCSKLTAVNGATIQAVGTGCRICATAADQYHRMVVSAVGPGRYVMKATARRDDASSDPATLNVGIEARDASGTMLVNSANTVRIGPTAQDAEYTASVTDAVKTVTGTLQGVGACFVVESATLSYAP